jgi:PTH1 family peptidyl-tRNA hydrolase
MKAIVGLGNPGPRYRYTRHNVGWMVLDQLAARWGLAKLKPEKARHAETLRGSAEGEPVLLVKPQTYMNDSGRAVRALVEKDRLAPEDLLIIYDDIDLALGRIRVRTTGSSGGHNGLKSIQQHLAQVLKGRGGQPEAREGRANDAGADGSLNPKPGDPPQQVLRGPASAGDLRSQPVAFPRIKVGIGRPPAGVDPIAYVLTTFGPDDVTLVQPAIERAADAAECWLREGIDVAMNRFNGLTGASAS